MYLQTVMDGVVDNEKRTERVKMLYRELIKKKMSVRGHLDNIEKQGLVPALRIINEGSGLIDIIKYGENLSNTKVVGVSAGVGLQ